MSVPRVQWWGWGGGGGVVGGGKWNANCVEELDETEAE